MNLADTLFGEQQSSKYHSYKSKNQFLNYGNSLVDCCFKITYTDGLLVQLQLAGLTLWYY